jgi:formyl-CoA transferase
MTGFRDMKPVRSGVTVGDTGSGLHCAIGILAALHDRQITGKGQRVSVAMQEAVINFGRINYASQAMLKGEAPPRKGNQSAVRGTSPSEAYPCKGGGQNDYCFIYSSRTSNRHWDALLKCIGREDVIGDPRFHNSAARYPYHEEIDAMITEWTLQYDKHEVMRRLQEAGVPAGAVLDTHELCHDPELRRRGMFMTMNDPVAGEYEMPGMPIKLSNNRVQIEQAPVLGQHNTEVLRDVLDMADDEIEALRRQSVI